MDIIGVVHFAAPITGSLPLPGPHLEILLAKRYTGFQLKQPQVPAGKLIRL